MGIRPKLAHGSHGRLLIGRIGIGVDKKDTHCLAALGQQGAGLLPDLLQIDRGVDAAVGQHPLIHFESQVARHDRLKAAAQTPGLGPVAPAHFQHIPKAASGDDAGARHFAFQQRVGPDRGPVHDGGDAGRRVGHAGHAVHETPRFLATRGGHLDDARAATGFIQHKQIGEGAAHIHSDDQTTSSTHAPSFFTAIAAVT